MKTAGAPCHQLPALAVGYLKENEGITGSPSLVLQLSLYHGCSCLSYLPRPCTTTEIAIQPVSRFRISFSATGGGGKNRVQSVCFQWPCSLYRDGTDSHIAKHKQKPERICKELCYKLSQGHILYIRLFCSQQIKLSNSQKSIIESLTGKQLNCQIVHLLSFFLFIQTAYYLKYSLCFYHERAAFFSTQVHDNTETSSTLIRRKTRNSSTCLGVGRHFKVLCICTNVHVANYVALALPWLSSLLVLRFSSQERGQSIAIANAFIRRESTSAVVTPYTSG